MPEVGTSPAVPGSQEIVNEPPRSVVDLPLDPEDNHDVEVIPDSDVIIFEPFLPLPKKFNTEISIIQASLKRNSDLKIAIYFHFLLVNSTLPLQKQRYLKQLGHHYQRLLINIILITISIARVLGHRRRQLRVPVRLLGRKDPRSGMDVICEVSNA